MLAPDVAPLHPGYICSMAFPFFTIGHSTRPIGEFIEMLRRADVRMVVDVRTIPRSRTNPQYNSETLKESIAEFQIGYEHIVELGGLRGRQREVPSELNAFWQNESFHNYADYALSEPFAHGLARLRALGGERRCAIMCAEAVWWRCHRRIIADFAVLARHTRVLHLAHDGRLTEHRPTAGARLRDERAARLRPRVSGPDRSR
jgi:uncharacterized protein (DUF488 family)